MSCVHTDYCFTGVRSSSWRCSTPPGRGADERVCFGTRTLREEVAMGTYSGTNSCIQNFWPASQTECQNPMAILPQYEHDCASKWWAVDWSFLKGDWVSFELSLCHSGEPYCHDVTKIRQGKISFVNYQYCRSMSWLDLCKLLDMKH